jgi:hypothetical protein
MLKVCNEQLLQDVFPPSDPRNISARILRHGLAVSAFSMLEKYIIDVFEYLLEKDISNSNLNFTNLPEGYKKFILIDSIIGLSNKMNTIKNFSDKFEFVQSNIALLSQYAATPPKYTALGFSPRGSNVGHDDIKRAFGTFGVKDAWGRMNNIAATFGGAALSLETNFKNLSNARHRSAHDPMSSIPIKDLESNIRSAIVIGICCDVMAKNLGLAIQMCRKESEIQKRIDNYWKASRFLDQQTDGTWLERSTINHRSAKRYKDRISGVAGVAGRRGAPFVIVRDTTGQPIELVG